tara:strand:+ start:495 stop:830 length:336 start_codon:yes stop_codon:yes gene_type:complete
MIFKKPPKQTPESLTHPKNKKTWNGSTRRPDSEQGFVKANRVHSVEGTRPPTNVKPVDLPSIDSVSTPRSRDITGCRPVPAGHRFTPAFQRDLTDQQMQLLTPKQRKKHKK